MGAVRKPAPYLRALMVLRQGMGEETGAGFPGANSKGETVNDPPLSFPIVTVLSQNGRSPGASPSGRAGRELQELGWLGTEMGKIREKLEMCLRHLLFCKACELSERVESRSPESIFLEGQREEKKSRPRVEEGDEDKEEPRGKQDRKWKSEAGGRRPGPGSSRAMVAAWPAFSPCALLWPALSVFTLGESLVTVTRKRYMDAVMPAIMNSSRPWRGFP